MKITRSIEKWVGDLNRERLESLLTSISIQVYDHESDKELREAVLANVEDNTISVEDLRAMLD